LKLKFYNKDEQPYYTRTESHRQGARLRGYYKLRKTELVDLLETPQRPPRRGGQKKPLGKVIILPKLEDIDIFENKSMTGS